MQIQNNEHYSICDEECVMTIILELTTLILILGGAGNDTFRGECGNDTVVFAGGAASSRNRNFAFCDVLFGQRKFEASNSADYAIQLEWRMKA